MKKMMTMLFILALSGSAGLWAQETAVPPAMPTPAPSIKLSDPLAVNVAANETTINDQTDVAVTVYNNDRALVRDRRKVKLVPGEIQLKFMDVAEQIQPETVSLVSLSDPGRLHILEQNYEYDLTSPEKLMEKYVGRDITLINKSNDINFFEQKAKLLSVNGGSVFEVDGKVYLGHPGTVVLPSIPGELTAKPSLIWLLDNQGTDHEMEATYLTKGMSWRADYVVNLDQNTTQMNLEGWVTLFNRSGAILKNAQLKVVAGEVNIVPDRMPRREKMMMDGGGAPMAMAAAPMQEESFAEYHLYTLPRRTTIKQNQSKQVSLLSGSGIAVKKVYEFRGDVAYYSSQFAPVKDQNPAVFLTFLNKEENQLGLPLPAGVMRVYQQDKSGMYQFAGEDQIKHTAKDEEIRLQLGKAFDVVGERVQTDFKQTGSNSYEAAFTITIRNHKEEAVTVDVIEPMAGTWKILEKSQEYQKKDAMTAIFTLAVPSDGEGKIDYRVRVQY